MSVIPPGAEGDSMCILLGAGTPFILRRIADKADPYTVIGEYYTHGMMDSKVLDAVESVRQFVLR
jgi:hypothetical protein